MFRQSRKSERIDSSECEPMLLKSQNTYYSDSNSV